MMTAAHRYPIAALLTLPASVRSPWSTTVEGVTESATRRVNCLWRTLPRSSLMGEQAATVPVLRLGLFGGFQAALDAAPVPDSFRERPAARRVVEAYIVLTRHPRPHRRSPLDTGMIVTAIFTLDMAEVVVLASPLRRTPWRQTLSFPVAHRWPERCRAAQTLSPALLGPGR